MDFNVNIDGFVIFREYDLNNFIYEDVLFVVEFGLRSYYDVYFFFFEFFIFDLEYIICVFCEKGDNWVFLEGRKIVGWLENFVEVSVFL